MIANTKSFGILGIAAGLLAVGGLSQADTITQTLNIGTNAPSFTTNLPYNLFDSNLGTLTGVTVELTTASTATVTIANLTGTPQSYTNASAVFPLTVTGPPGSTTYVSTSISATSAGGTVAPNSSVNIPVTGTSDSGAIPIPNVPSTTWPTYFEAPGGGTDTFPFVFTASAGTYSVTGGDLLVGGSGSVGGTVTLVYTYQATGTVPEPGTWALVVASAGVSIAGLRRRKIAKA